MKKKALLCDAFSAFKKEKPVFIHLMLKVSSVTGLKSLIGSHRLGYTLGRSNESTNKGYHNGKSRQDEKVVTMAKAVKMTKVVSMTNANKKTPTQLGPLNLK